MSVVRIATTNLSLPRHKIADGLITSRATATGLIDSLERRKYERRRAHLTDRRILLVEITEKGRQVADEYRPVVHLNHKRFLKALNDEEQARLTQLLVRIQDDNKGSKG